MHRWHEAWRHGGKLRAKPHAGPKPKLSKLQKRRLVQALLKGTHHWGYAVSGWTGPVVRDLIQRMFGVVDHADHIPRLLRGLGWSPQKPVQRARERDEERIARWKREDWPRIKKSLDRQASVVVVDESGYFLRPLRRRVWSLEGHTPIHHVWDNDLLDEL